MKLSYKQLSAAIVISAVMFFVAGCVSSVMPETKGLPPKEADAPERLSKSPRHGEYIIYTAAMNDPVEAYIVYPEVKEKAPVVIVIHEIFGLSDWVRSVADQIAAEGFIAIAPDFLSGKGPDGKGSRGLTSDQARALFTGIDPAQITRRLDGAAAYATSLPAAEKKYATVGFCWGGGISFSYATTQPSLTAAVVYYGTSPATETLKGVNASILGLYGGSDERVDATIPAAENELAKLGKSYEKEIYAGAGHAFLRQQDGMDGANLKATQAAWPRTIRFLKKAFGMATSSIGTKPGLATSIAMLAVPDACCDETE